MTLVGHFAALDPVVELHVPRGLARPLAEALGDIATDRPATIRVEIRRDPIGRWSIRTGDTVETLTGGADAGLHAAIAVISDIAARSAASLNVVLRAGSVEIDGAAVALARVGGARTSTLTAALSIAGHAYLADEVTAVTADRTVRAFHRPVGLRVDGAAALGVTIPPGPYQHTFPLRIGPGAARCDGAPLGTIVLVRHEDAPPGATRIDAARALFQLADMTLEAAGHERAMFRRLADLVRVVPVYELCYRDVADGVRLVEDLTSRKAA